MNITIKRPNGGASNEYTYLHNWVKQQLGKPQKCDFCKSTTEKKYEWSNKSGQYLKDIRDWQRLCTRCHRKYDNHSGRRRTTMIHRLGSEEAYIEYMAKIGRNGGFKNKKPFATACIKGHEFTPGNTRLAKPGGYQICKTCSSEYMRNYKKIRRELKK